MTDNRIHDASWDIVNSVHELNQTVANSAVAVQDRNLRFAQSIFLNGVEVLENQTEQTRQLMQEWGQQVQKQQEAFQRLAYATVDTYMNFFRAPFVFYQQLLNVAESATQRGLETAEHMTQRGLAYTQSTARQTTDSARHVADVAGDAAQRGFDQAEKATHQEQ